MRQPIWQKAASFAARMHEHEHRDDDETPYFSHPARVALTVAEHFGCPDQAAIAAALLHDVLENTDEGYDALERRFGREVTEIVVALTKNMMLPRAERNRDYEKRLKKADWRARLVKAADEFDNLSDAMTGLKNGRRELRAKCRLVVRLLKPDLKAHPEAARATRALKQILRAHRLK